MGEIYAILTYRFLFYFDKCIIWNDSGCRQRCRKYCLHSHTRTYFLGSNSMQHYSSFLETHRLAARCTFFGKSDFGSGRTFWTFRHKTRRFDHSSFSNMIAGHIVILAFISLIFIFGAMSTAAGWGFSPFSVIFVVFDYFIEILVAFIQAFIFTALTAI